MLGALVLGCSEKGTPSANHSGAPTQKEVTYFRCLEKQGIVLEELEDSRLRVDKDDPANDGAKQMRAQEACKGLLPKEEAPEATEEQLAAAREFSACVRAQGIKDYPDPDPKTGDTPLSEKIGNGDKEALRAAQRACAPGDGGSGHLGG